MKKNVVLSIISVLVIAVIVLGVLYISNNNVKTKKIEEMDASLIDKTSQIETLTADVADKAGQIDTLTADVADKAGQIDALTADIADKASHIETLTASVSEKNSEIEDLNRDIANKTGQIETLTEDAKTKADEISSLTKEIAEKESDIATLSSSLESEQVNNRDLNSLVLELKKQLSYDTMNEEELRGVIEQVSERLLSFDFTVKIVPSVESTYAELFLNEDPNALSHYGYVTTDSVNVRIMASTTGRRIGSARKYMLLYVYGTVESEGDTWYKVSYKNQDGFIIGTYFKQMTVSEAESFIYSDLYKEGIENNPE